MTKKELLEYLQPFTDELDIYISMNGKRHEIAKPKYVNLTGVGMVDLIADEVIIQEVEILR